MSILLWLSSARYLLNRPWQMALSVLGITLGVAVVVAIDLGNQSAKRAFSLSSDAVTGKATHQIVGGTRRSLTKMCIARCGWTWASEVPLR